MPPIRINVDAKKTYGPQILRRPNLQQAKFALSSKIKCIFSKTKRCNRLQLRENSKSKKKYEKPGYKKLSPEQIKLILIGQFNLGDESAGDLLDRLFSESYTPPANAKKTFD